MKTLNSKLECNRCILPDIREIDKYNEEVEKEEKVKNKIKAWKERNKEKKEKKTRI